MGLIVASLSIMEKNLNFNEDDDGAEDEDGGLTFQDSLLIIDEDAALAEVL